MGQHASPSCARTPGPWLQGLSEEANLELISADALIGFQELVEDLGGDYAEILQICGIEPADLDGAASKISFTAMANLLEESAFLLRCPDFGMRLAERQHGPSTTKPLDRLICNAPTLGKATRSAINHMDAYSPAIRETLEFDRNKQLFAIRFDFVARHLPVTPQLSERILLLVHTSSVELTGSAARAREVWFSHSRVAPKAAYEARFGAPVKFKQEYDAVFFTGDDLRQRVVGSDCAAFRTECDLISERYPAPNEDFEDLVRDYLRDNLPLRPVTRRNVAEYLGVSTRTLHRKLNERGWTFETIRDDVRRDLAVRFLARADLSLTEAAAKLGYSELAVLSRSCQRWFASTPGTLRHALTRNQFQLDTL